MTEATQIQEVFGQFAIDIEGTVELFPTEAAAATALAAYTNGAENTAAALQFTAYKGLDGKNAKSKVNVIVEFLNWVDAGQPEKEEAPAETPAAETDAPADSEVPPVDSSEEDDIAF